jgi:trimethylamine--corrinoid protein Co-methyltransferase
MKRKMDSAFKIIDRPMIEKIIGTAYDLFQQPGLKVFNDEALRIFDSAGAQVDSKSRVVKLPRKLVEDALKTIPHVITLHNLKGEPEVYAENNNVYFYPGTLPIVAYDYEKKIFREPHSKDLKDFAKVVEKLHYMSMQGPPVCKDVPDEFADIYRLALTLKHSKKPVKAALFVSKEAIGTFKDLLFAVAGGEKEYQKKPFSFTSINVDPPLMWNDFITQVLIDCAKSKIPLSLGSMAVSGAAAPVTLIGSLIQHTAEVLSAATLSQIVQPGSPGLYGSSPVIFDVRKGTTPMGAIETIMFASGCAQIGKFLGIPTHLYSGLSDSKVIDAQCGFECAMGILLGALSGINLCAVGMLNFETACSIENIVIANEICGMAQRMIDGIESSEEDFTTKLWEEVGHNQNFLGTLHTIAHFGKEQFKVSEIVDRGSDSDWRSKGAKDTAQRAHEMVKDILAESIPKVVDPKVEEEIDRIVIDYARRLGIRKDQIPREFFTD